MRPLLLDLFCGAGGAAMGYHRAGFDVIGVDIEDQPHYPFTFLKVDAIEYMRGMVLRLERESLRHPGEFADAIHASPPCQFYSDMSACRPSRAYARIAATNRPPVGHGECRRLTAFEPIVTV
jgi:DNA (cytosine-5)-methyltransferase 1